MRTQGSCFHEITSISKRAINFVSRHLMITFASLPCGITRFVFSCNPCLTRCIQKVLGTKDVHRKKQLWVFYTAIHMTFGGKVNHIIDVVVSKKTVNQVAVAYITTNKHTTLIVDVVLNCSQIACVCKQVEHNNLDVFVLILLFQEVLDVVGTDKAGRPCYEIGFHNYMYLLFFILVC